MFLKNLTIFNYRSCKKLDIELNKDEPNVFIGINDCGKTSILKAIGLLLDDKPQYNSLRENSSKRDFSNSPLKREEFNLLMAKKGLPILEYLEDQTIVLGQFIVENDDIDLTDQGLYSNQFLWAIERAVENAVWIARVFKSNSTAVSTYLLVDDVLSTDGTGLELWSVNSTELTRRIKEIGIESDEIENENQKGRFTNLEKIRAIYTRLTPVKTWASFKYDKNDKLTFPGFRYLDWNASLEDIKRTATDAMSSVIDGHIRPLRVTALQTARDVEIDINTQLAGLAASIGTILPTITEVKTTVNISVQETVTDIMVTKQHSDGDIHIDLQGEGVKRQIWFALIKSGSLASIKSGQINKRFIWAFDEPETHLYPSAQRQFFETIRDVSLTNVQSLISTHSTVFIDKSKLNTIRSVCLGEDSYTEYCECASVNEVFESLELRNSDFLFYDKFLVIEGDTELQLIPALYRLYKGRSLAEDNIQLVNLSGKNKWLEGKRSLEGVLAGFKKSDDYVVYLFDRDMLYELGEDAITDKMFFIGRQDIEDSIANEVWTSVVSEITDGTVKMTTEEMQSLKDLVPIDRVVGRHDKFYSLLEVMLKEKLSESKGERVTWNVLPNKGSDLVNLLMKHLNSVDYISPGILRAFDKLSE